MRLDRSRPDFPSLLLVLLSAFALVPARPAPSQATMVVDLNPGAGGSFPFPLAELDGKVIMVARNSDTDPELWITDGTAIGTTLLADTIPGAASGGLVLGDVWWTVFDGRLFFTIWDPFNGGKVLWVTDGTPGGTAPFFDFNASAFDTGNPYYPTVLGDTLYIFADDGVVGTELWKTDGTPGGTVFVRDINPGSDDCYPQSVAAIGDKLFFGAHTDDDGTEPWVSDGTAAGTMQLADLIIGANPSSPNNFFGHGAYVYFAANSTMHGREIFRTQGAVGDVTLVHNIRPFGGSDPTYVLTYGPYFYFFANDGTTGFEPWRSDGTSGGTIRLGDLNPGSASSETGEFFQPSIFAEHAGHVVFNAKTATEGVELFVTDGTPGGTALLEDINPTGDSSPWFFAPGSISLAFSADDGTSGNELWVTHATPGRTGLFQDINPGPGDSSPHQFFPLGGNFLFAADNGTHGFELWIVAQDDLLGPGPTAARDWSLFQ